MARGASKTVTIADSQTVSAAVQLVDLYDPDNLGVVGIYAAAGWATADVTFQVSFDGVTYTVLKNASGTVVTVSQLAATDWRGLDPVDFLSAFWIKAVSSATQSGGDTLTLILRSI
jgi:hypothetical protein